MGAKVASTDGQQVIQAPAQWREASVRADSFDMKDRTVEVVWAAGAGVRRGGWWSDPFDEFLEMTSKAVRADRLKSGRMAVLDNHNNYTGLHGDRRYGQIGKVVEGGIRDKDGEGWAKVQYSRRAQIEDLLRDLEDGIVGESWSVGYWVHQFQDRTKKGDEVRQLWGIDWEPFEISPVSIPADVGANARAENEDGSKIATKRCVILVPSSYQRNGGEGSGRQPEATEDESTNRSIGGSEEPTSEEGTMSGKKTADQTPTERAVNNDPPGDTPTASSTPAPVDAEAIIRKERDRCETIRANVKVAGLGDELAADLIARGATLEDAGKAIFAAMAKRTSANRPNTQSPSVSEPDIRATADGYDKFREGVREALMLRCDVHGAKATDASNGLRGVKTKRLFEEMLKRKGGIDVPMDDRGLWDLMIQRSHSTSDFPLLLEDVMNKGLAAPFELMPPTYRKLATKKTARDFRNMNNYYGGEAFSLDQIAEGQEYSFKTFGEAKSSWRIYKYGAGISFTWEAFVNDDLDAFSRAPGMFSEAQIQKENELAWAIITGNATAYDGVALFHDGSHNNDKAASTPINAAGIKTMVLSFANRYGINASTPPNQTRRRIRVTPYALALPPDLLDVALTAFAATSPNSTSDFNPWANFISRDQMIVEPLLSDNDATLWYAFGRGPGLINFEYAKLEGDGDTPELRREDSFSSDVIKWRARTTFGVHYPQHQTAFRADS